MKAVIFDMDGVIVDSEPIHMEIERELLEELGGQITPEEHNSLIGTTDYYMWSTFKDKFNIPLPVEEMIRIKKERFIENIHKLELVDNFENLLLALYHENYLLGLASSNNRKAVNMIVEKFDLDKYLKFIISGEEVTRGKPDPEIFVTTAEKMEIPASQCLVIEDAANGVNAAKSAGMKCIGFKNPNSGIQDLSEADLIVDSFQHLTTETMKSLFY